MVLSLISTDLMRSAFRLFISKSHVSHVIWIWKFLAYLSNDTAGQMNSFSSPKNSMKSPCKLPVTDLPAFIWRIGQSIRILHKLPMFNTRQYYLLVLNPYARLGTACVTETPIIWKTHH